MSEGQRQQVSSLLAKVVPVPQFFCIAFVRLTAHHFYSIVGSYLCVLLCRCLEYSIQCHFRVRQSPWYDFPDPRTIAIVTSKRLQSFVCSSLADNPPPRGVTSAYNVSVFLTP